MSTKSKQFEDVEARGNGVHKKEHFCTLEHQKYELPSLDGNETFIERLVYKYRRLILISEDHPYSKEYVRSYIEIRRIQYDQYYSKSLIIHPFSKLRAYYDMAMIAGHYFTSFLLPADAVYDLYNHPNDDIFYPHDIRFTNIMTSLLCIGMIIVNFMTGYTVHKYRKIVMAPKKIAINYMFGWFFLPDLLSSLPEPFFIKNHTLQTSVASLGILRVARIPTLFYCARATMDYFKFRNKWLLVVKNILTFYLILHWSACSQFYLPHVKQVFFRNFNVNSWIYMADMNLDDFLNIYLRCLFQSTGQILCINYSNIKAGEIWDESVLQIVTSMLGKILTIYVSIRILEYLLASRSLETQYQETLSQVRSFMSKKKLSVQMQTKIIDFYKYKYNNKFFKESKMANLISERLRAGVNLNVCSKLLQSVPFLSQLPQKQLEQLVKHLKSEIYLPHDVIIRAGTSENCMYFLACGTVAVWTPAGKEICHLHDGAHFGEISLIIKNKKRTANIVALEICEVYKLERKIFRSCFNNQNQKLLTMIEDMARARLEATEEVSDLDDQSQAKFL